MPCVLTGHLWVGSPLAGLPFDDPFTKVGDFYWLLEVDMRTWFVLGAGRIHKNTKTERNLSLRIQKDTVRNHRHTEKNLFTRPNEKNNYGDKCYEKGKTSS